MTQRTWQKPCVHTKHDHPKPSHSTQNKDTRPIKQFTSQVLYKNTQDLTRRNCEGMNTCMLTTKDKTLRMNVRTPIRNRTRQEFRDLDTTLRTHTSEHMAHTFEAGQDDTLVSGFCHQTKNKTNRSDRTLTQQCRLLLQNCYSKRVIAKDSLWYRHDCKK